MLMIYLRTASEFEKVVLKKKKGSIKITMHARDRGGTFLSLETKLGYSCLLYSSAFCGEMLYPASCVLHRYMLE